MNVDVIMAVSLVFLIVGLFVFVMTTLMMAYTGDTPIRRLLFDFAGLVSFIIGLVGLNSISK